MTGNFAFFVGAVFGAFMGMALLSLLFTKRSTSWYTLRCSAWDALLALDKGDVTRARNLLNTGLKEA